jgi:hypothetical protein
MIGPLCATSGHTRTSKLSCPESKRIGGSAGFSNRATDRVRCSSHRTSKLFQQAYPGNISMLVAKATRLAHVSPQLVVVVAQRGEHIQGVTCSASLSRKRCKRPRWPIERRELPSLSLLSFPPARLCQSRGWSSSVEGCSCSEQMSPPPKSSSGCGCVRRLGGRCFLASCFMRLNMMLSVVLL